MPPEGPNAPNPGDGPRPETSQATFTISQYLEAPPDRFGKRLRGAMKAIESVHRVAQLPQIPVNVTRSPKGCEYLKHGGTGKPIAINVSRKSAYPELSFVHEVGHFIEQAGIPGHFSGDRRWEVDTLMKPLLDVAATTRAIAASKRMHKEKQDDPLQRYFSYLLRPEEIWARCYAQYIAIRSADATLVGQLERARCSQAEDAIQLRWSDDDFRSVADAIDALFRSIGWRG
jgi:hypothetical protein